MAAQGADKGTIQMVDPHDALRIVAQRGFGREFLDHFACVRVDGSSVCARSLRSGSPLVILDVFEDPVFAPHLEVARRSGFRAVQSIPLLSRWGSVIGMLSVHYESPLRSSDWRMQSLQESARRAALVLESALSAPTGSSATDPRP
ncbi:MAG TPA: GAF domain-containing protein [Burkholderiales bacterium]|nr:GAF domain-containing protein [Burkholderiales bacterium]